MAKEKTEDTAAQKPIQALNIASKEPVKMIKLGAKASVFYDPENRLCLVGNEERVFPEKVTRKTREHLQAGGLIEFTK